MNKVILLLGLFILSFSVVSLADDSEQVITLKDGSQIKGVLSGIDNGVYTVKTPIIGDVHVAAGDVASITNPNASTATLPANNTPAPANMDQQIETTQQRLMSNPQSMATIQQMAQDPEIQQALQDPALIQAVQNHDLTAVQNNPGVQKMLNDPKMKALLLQLASQAQQPPQNSSSQ